MRNSVNPHLSTRINLSISLFSSLVEINANRSVTHRVWINRFAQLGILVEHVWTCLLIYLFFIDFSTIDTEFVIDTSEPKLCIYRVLARAFANNIFLDFVFLSECLSLSLCLCYSRINLNELCSIVVNVAKVEFWDTSWKKNIHFHFWFSKVGRMVGGCDWDIVAATLSYWASEEVGFCWRNPKRAKKI